MAGFLDVEELSDDAPAPKSSTPKAASSRQDDVVKPVPKPKKIPKAKAKAVEKAPVPAKAKAKAKGKAKALSKKPAMKNVLKATKYLYHASQKWGIKLNSKEWATVPVSVAF